MEITIEEMQKKFEGLPEDLKWAIMGANVDEKIIEIGKKYNLNVEELGQLSLETHGVMLGYILPDQFEESIRKSLNFPELKTKELAEEINEEIFKNIRERLMQQRKKEEENSEKSKILEENELAEEKNEVENKEDEQEKKRAEENKKIMDSISSQKLSASFKIPTIKTEYTTNDLTKEKRETSGSQHDKIPLEATLRPASSSSKDLSPSYSVKEDPYRMKPE
jgi:hypothetical protein